MLWKMGMDLRANRQMTSTRCRSGGQDGSEMVQVRGDSGWEHGSGGEKWLDSDTLMDWMWCVEEREVSMETSEMAFTKGGRLCGADWGGGVISQVLFWGIGLLRCPVDPVLGVMLKNPQDWGSRERKELQTQRQAIRVYMGFCHGTG